MTLQEVLDFLSRMEHRVVVLEREAQQTLDRAQQALEHLGSLREDLRKIDRAVRALAPAAEQGHDPEETPRP
jgi:hypothetical protein